jgi:hypothetical protein
VSEELALKRISAGAVESALDRADHYRLLNDPGPAESICLDVLEVESGNERAMVSLVLAITDQFSDAKGTQGVKRAHDFAKRLGNKYQRDYYEGLIHERQARGMLGRGMVAGFAYDGFRDAMDCYERAEDNRPQGNDDALLRYNSCVRTIRAERLSPRTEPEYELPLE